MKRPIKALEQFTFLVPSDREQVHYRVEIDAYNFAGCCDCRDFQCRHEPKLSRGAKPSDELRCKHIKRARSYFLDEILPLIAKELTRKK